VWKGKISWLHSPWSPPRTLKLRVGSRGMSRLASFVFRIGIFFIIFFNALFTMIYPQKCTNGAVLTVSTPRESHDQLQKRNFCSTSISWIFFSGLKISLAAVSENSHVLLTHAAHLEPFAKSVDRPQSAEVRKVPSVERETHFPGPSEYPAQSTLLDGFVPRGFGAPITAFCALKISDVHDVKSSPSRFLKMYRSQKS